MSPNVDESTNAGQFPLQTSPLISERLHGSVRMLQLVARPAILFYSQYIAVIARQRHMLYVNFVYQLRITSRLCHKQDHLSYSGIG